MPPSDALDRGTDGRATSPVDRSTTDPGTQARGQLGVEGGVDLGGTWDADGNYWYTEDTGRTWRWREPEKAWEVFSSPDEAIRVHGIAPGQPKPYTPTPHPPHPYAEWHAGVGRRYYQRTGPFGIGALPVAHAAAFAAEKGSLILGTVVNQSALLAHPPLERVREEMEQVLDQWKEDAEQRERDYADMQAEGRGDLYRLPVTVYAAGTTKKVIGRGGSRPSVPARVDNYVKEMTKTYRESIVRARKGNPRASASEIGRIAERDTLARAEEIARACELDPGHIWVGNFPVGVTGPKGGASTAEVGSQRYKFIMELKKSPRADRGPQDDAHRVAVEESVNFEEGGRYFRVYGENYEGEGVKTVEMGEADVTPEFEVP
jgi:hypothetical protein